MKARRRYARAPRKRLRAGDQAEVVGLELRRRSRATPPRKADVADSALLMTTLRRRAPEVRRDGRISHVELDGHDAGIGIRRASGGGVPLRGTRSSSASVNALPMPWFAPVTSVLLP